MKKSLMPYVLQGISSLKVRRLKRSVYSFKRTLLKQTPTLTVFLKADDPYSYLLVQALIEFQARFNVRIQCRVFQHLDPDMYPRILMWRDYAKYDAYYLARLYGYRFPVKEHLPKRNEAEADQLAFALSAIEQDDDFLEQASIILDHYWFGLYSRDDSQPISQEGVEKAQVSLAKNQNLLEQKGHYLGASIYFEGEWYWGIDRLDHLERRLIDDSLSINPDEKVFYNKTYENFCKAPNDSLNSENSEANTMPLTLYWSARSPYSYIGLERSIQMAKYYQVPLNIKPVLPMMMRGMNVPDKKKMYIFLDTKREAGKLGIPYGKVADPLGLAVERCYSLIEYAEENNKLQDFLLSFARGVNAEGIRAETDRGLKKIVTRCGLDWAVAKKKLHDLNWKNMVQENLDDMFANGCWGVPTICYRDLKFWGQDRFGLVEASLKNDRLSS